MIKKSSLNSVALPDGGIYVMRSEHIYLLAACQPIGINGVGAHKHNDWLSFELCVDDQPIIIDPGTFCYTGNMEMRRLFRSTKYHNTVVVDGREQIEIHNSMFGLTSPHGDVRVLRWESEETHDLLEAEHTGYTRLAEPVTHRRQFLLNKRKNEVEITDTFIGDGEHSFAWYYHLDVGLQSENEVRKIFILQDRKIVLEIEAPDFEIIQRKERGWVSKAYNRRESAEIVCFEGIAVLSSNPSFTQRISINDDFLGDEKE
uniref:Heparinase II/III-family protein n=1 Tax=Candidatus Desulfatibia profunda TaxID=2841695 RepID=A0A8J6NR54_9BACT|nr:heparinase II/III-family protein [Candidatus Desulfatibia profunda]